MEFAIPQSHPQLDSRGQRAYGLDGHVPIEISEFLGLVLPDAPPISRTRRLIDLEMHEAVFTWILQRLADAGLVMATSSSELLSCKRDVQGSDRRVSNGRNADG